MTCGDSDSNGCLDWAKALDCNNQICSGGFCADKCTSECTTKGAKKCDSGGISVCDDFNNDGCMEWGTPKQCDSGQTCSAGACLDKCKSECTAIGAKKCDDAGKVTICADDNKDGCLEWGTGAACATGLVCDGGFCANKCSNQCTVSGAKKCDEGGKVTVCGDYNKDGCLEWGSGTPCGAGTVCSGGVCAQQCSNACNVKNARQCVAGQQGKFELCDDYNSDGCLEWGTAQACAAGQVCSLGNCAATCQNACNGKGDVKCDGEATRTCGDYNSDGCLEWGTANPCEVYEACITGQCKLKPAPGKVIINELMYDSAGGDDDTFVELWGPAGTSLAGFSLIGVNGNGGANYNVLELSGVIPSDGFFVVAHTKAAEWIAKQADLKSDLVDYQNGPDSVQLRYGSKVVDAVGYGSFGSEKSAGEGASAVDPPGGQSLGRDDKQADTDDNSKDFKAYVAPTPGSANSVGNKPPKANIICPQSGSPTQKLTFDATGSTDPDGTIKIWAFDFGDAAKENSTTGKAEHAFAKDGTYTVKVTVSDDAGETDTATCLVSIDKPNALPKAVLKCPAQLGVGKTGEIDGSGSTDSDGKIVVWSFGFGDGSTAESGPNSKVNHAWTKAGAYKVVLTITDDGGAKATTSCDISISDATPPQVTIVKPGADKTVTQGDKLPMIVDATPPKGKTISQAWVEADGASIGADVSAPYNFEFTVPASAKTGSIIALVAKAKDSSGTVGDSTPIKLTVVNDKPVAKFIATVSGKLKVVMDATPSSDAETAATDLEVRWDFTSDGKWDTPWSKAKVYEHTYPADGKYDISMEVRDAVGQIATAKKTVSLSSIQYVSGDIATTTWSGTIVITGDVSVKGGQTLTIAKGTQVLFTFIDQNKDGIGDFEITASGKLVVQGTETDPVVFTVYGKDKKPGKGWNRIIVAGAGSSIDYAIIENAQTGLDIKAAATIKNTTMRANGTGMEVRDGGNATLVTNTITKNVGDGLYMHPGAVVTEKGGLYSENGQHGIAMDGRNHAGTSLNASDCSLTTNGGVGLWVHGYTKGLVTHCAITENAYEGVRIQAYQTLDPSLQVRVNNIFENGAVGARVLAKPGLSITSSSSASTTVTSKLWSPPKNADGTLPTIELVRISYSENDSSSNYIRGYVLNQSQATLLSSNSGTSAHWEDIASKKATGLIVRVTDTYYSRYGTMTVHEVAYQAKGVAREVSVITHSKKVDLRHNYLGTFPKVHAVVELNHSNAADLHGFVGVAYGSTWDNGPYWGGTTLTKDETWSGTIYVTGNLTVPAGKTLTIAAGTKVDVVRFDQDANGIGDFYIGVQGKLLSAGSNASPVVITEHGNIKKSGAWDTIEINGGSAATDLKHTIIEYANTGLKAGAGAHSLADVEVRHSKGRGLSFIVTQMNAKGINLHDNGAEGLHLHASKGTYDELTVSSNGASGIFVGQYSLGLTIKNSTIEKNAGAGVLVHHGKANISFCTIKSNALGVHFRGQAGGSLKRSNVLYNQGEGILLTADVAQQPSPVIGGTAQDGNNIYGNSVSAGGVLANANLTAQSSSSASIPVTKGPWQPPESSKTVDGKVVKYRPIIVAMRVSYSESDSSSNYIRGYVRKDSASGAELFSASSNVSARWYDIEDYKTSALYAIVTDTYYSRYGTVSVQQTFYRADNVLKELSAITGSGKVDCKGNYWGVFPDVQKMFTLSRSDAIDYQGFVGGEKSGNGPQ